MKTPNHKSTIQWIDEKNTEKLCFKALFSLFYVSTILAENLKYESWKNIFVPAVYINQNNWKELGKDSSQVANSVLVNDSLVGFLI